MGGALGCTQCNSQRARMRDSVSMVTEQQVMETRARQMARAAPNVQNASVPFS